MGGGGGLISARSGTRRDDSRVFTIDTTGVAEVMVIGLPWRAQVCQQVFEEAAGDPDRRQQSATVGNPVRYRGHRGA